jgi:hypothetical protein
MINGINEVLDSFESEGAHVPVEVEGKVGRTWAG